MKNKIISFLLIGSLALIVLNSLYITPVKGTEAINPTAERIISTNGEGKITAIPDVAYVNVGVVAENKELAKAQEEATNAMNGIMVELKSFGLKDEEIKTTSFQVNPLYKWNDLTRVNAIVGYEVSNTVEITVYDINGFGSLLDKVINAGGNRVSGINFGLKDESELYNKALALAVKDAEVKAKTIGKTLNSSKLIPLRVVEGSTGYRPMYSMDSMNIKAESSSTPINPGEITVTATVNIDFGF